MSHARKRDHAPLLSRFVYVVSIGCVCAWILRILISFSPLCHHLSLLITGSIPLYLALYLRYGNHLLMYNNRCFLRVSNRSYRIRGLIMTTIRRSPDQTLLLYWFLQFSNLISNRCYRGTTVCKRYHRNCSQSEQNSWWCGMWAKTARFDLNLPGRLRDRSLWAAWCPMYIKL